MADTTFTAGTPIASTWLNDVNDFVYGNTPQTANLVNFLQSGSGTTSRTVQNKLRDLPVSPSDYTAFGSGFSSTNGIQFPAGTFTTATALSPTAKTIIKGSGRENTFIRTSSASAAVFSSTAQFVTYEDVTIDRSGGVAGSGITHAGVNNSTPLEGFKVKNCNINGHTTGISLNDFVLASIDDSYIQSGTTGVNCNITGAQASTMLTMNRCWVRGNTTDGVNCTGIVNASFNQVAFETGATGANLGACNDVVFSNCWFESLNLGASLVNCASVVFNSGQVDGGSLTTRAFSFNGATTPSTVTFDGAWRVSNMGGKIFATADVGVTIYVKSPELASYTFQAVNGGKVIYDFVLEGKATWNPANCAANTKTASTTVTVTGASLGDICIASFENGTSDPQNFVFKADCFSADTITVSGYNINSGAVDLGSGTLSVRVYKRASIS